MGAVSVRRRGTGSPDPPKTWRAPPATLVPNGIAMEGFVHGQLAGRERGSPRLGKPGDRAGPSMRIYCETSAPSRGHDVAR